MGLFDEFEKEPDGPRGDGVYCQVTVEPGYAVFATGVKAEFFAPVDMSAEAFAAARQLANSAAAVNGGKLQKVVQFTLHADSVLGGRQWKGDVVKKLPVWTDTYNQIVKPSIDAHIGEGDVGKRVWAHVLYKKDLWQPPTPELDENGNERVKMVAYIAARYSSREEAEAAMNGAGSAQETFGVPAPDGWDEKDAPWGQTVAEVYKAFAEKLGGKTERADVWRTAISLSNEWGGTISDDKIVEIYAAKNPSFA